MMILELLLITIIISCTYVYTNNLKCIKKMRLKKEHIELTRKRRERLNDKC